MNLVIACLGVVSAGVVSEPVWQQDFAIKRHLLVSEGRSAYFVLEPGHRLELVNGDHRLTTTVLHKTEWIHGVMARLIEEREVRAGAPCRVRHRYCAIDRSNGDVYLFGESLEEFRGWGQPTRRSFWRSGQGGVKFGLLMPGKPAPGMAYIQEYAPKVAMDRSQVLGLVGVQTPAGSFERAVRIQETSALDPKQRVLKTYAPGLGLVQSGALKLCYRPKQGRLAPHVGEVQRSSRK